MKCPKCSHLNEDEARYCNNCGFPLAEKKKDWTSILLLIWCVIALFTFIIGRVTQFLPVLLDLHSGQTLYMNVVIIPLIFLPFTLTNLLIPFAIPKIGYKIAAFIIIGILDIASIVFIIFQVIAHYNIYSHQF